MEAIIDSGETSRIKPTIDQTYENAVRTAVEDANKTFARSVMFSEIANMFLLVEHNVATTPTAKQVKINRDRVVQKEGNTLTRLLDEQNPHKQYEKVSENRVQSDGFRVPEKTLNEIKKQGYSQWHKFCSAAFEWYFSQPFTTVSHLLEVQLDVLCGEYKTQLGSSLEGKWYHSMNSDNIGDWRAAYDRNTSQNTTHAEKAEIVDAVCDHTVDGDVTRERAVTVIQVITGITTESSIQAIVDNMKAVTEDEQEEQDEQEPSVETENVDQRMGELV